MTINGEEIETTPWHLFLTDNGWTEAEDLQVGDSIVSLGGVYGTVDSVIIENTTQTMYDFTVEDVHTFSVGDGDWVVHNCNGKISLGIEEHLDEFSDSMNAQSWKQWAADEQRLVVLPI